MTGEHAKRVRESIPARLAVEVTLLFHYRCSEVISRELDETLPGTRHHLLPRQKKTAKQPVRNVPEGTDEDSIALSRRSNWLLRHSGRPNVYKGCAGSEPQRVTGDEKRVPGGRSSSIRANLTYASSFAF
jgi:hypothetical protein